MVELGKCMLLLLAAIPGNVTVPGASFAIAAAYNLQLGCSPPLSPPPLRHPCHRRLPAAAIAAAITMAALAIAAALAAAALFASHHHRVVGGCLSPPYGWLFIIPQSRWLFITLGDVWVLISHVQRPNLYL